MKSFTLAVAVVCMAASVFAATDAERIEALEKKVAELSRKVSVEAPLSVREAYTWHRARLMGLEGAVRHYVLKSEQKNRREIPDDEDGDPWCWDGDFRTAGLCDSRFKCHCVGEFNL